MQVILNKKEKEELVIKLHQENKTIRQIAEIVHMSFKDIGAIIRKLDGRTNDDNNDIDLSNKSKATQAMFLFKSGKKPIDVAIDLDITANEIEDILQEYWVLNQLDELALIYYEVRNHLDLFLKLFQSDIK
jgi:ribosomal protein L22